MAKRRAYQKKTFESNGSTSDTSANLYMSMLLSPAWTDLTDRQKVLYLYAKSRLYGQRTKEKEALFEQYLDLKKPTNIDSFFSLSIGDAVYVFKLYSKTNQHPFYRDVEALIAHGFIRCIACGNIARVKTIYQFSDKWQLWGTDSFIIEPKEMTSSMRKKYFATIESQ